MEWKNEEIEHGAGVAAPKNTAAAVVFIEELIDRLLKTTTFDADVDGIILSLSPWHIQGLDHLLGEIGRKVRAREIQNTIRLQQFIAIEERERNEE